jgi:hypothetical protein
MEIKPTNAYQHLRVSCIINIMNPLHVHVSATLVAIFREVSYKGYVTKTSRDSLIFYISALVLGSSCNVSINYVRYSYIYMHLLVLSSYGMNDIIYAVSKDIVLCYKSEGRWFDSRWCH